MWVQALTRNQLHGLAGKLRRDYQTIGLTDRQDWLLEQCFAELEWRQRTWSGYPWCGCDLCWLPDAWDDTDHGGQFVNDESPPPF